jgi:hypothetical protein
VRTRLAPNLQSRVARSTALPLVAAALIYLVVGYSAGAKIGRAGDPAAFINPGENFLAPELLPPNAYVYPQNGYDGQLFFYLAQDPLLTGKVASRDEEYSPHIGAVAYRYQRILLPALGWLTSWGHPRLLEWTMPLINVIAVLGAGFLLAKWLASRGRSPWLALVYMVSIGIVVGVVNDLADPLAASLFIAGVVWWLDRRIALAVLALAACLLARELYLIPVAAIALLELIRDRRHAVPWLIPLGVFGVWQAYLRLALAGPVTPEEAAKPSIVPLWGAMRKVWQVIHEDWLGAANWEVLFVTLLLLISFFFLVKCIDPIDRLRRTGELPAREQLLPIVAFASVLTVPFLTLALWGYIPSYARYSAPASGMLVLIYGISRDAAARLLMIALMALSLTNPVVALLPYDNREAIEVPKAPP